MGTHLEDFHSEPDEQSNGQKTSNPALTEEQVEIGPELAPALKLKFHGSAKEYFRIWIVNLCLTLLTLGVYSAWAKVRKKRYLYSHTTLAGTPFQYLGLPIPILKGRLIAAVGFLIYYLSSHFITFLLPFVLLIGLIAAPWVISRSAAFTSRYSAFRNMTFHFNGRYMEALKVLYAWGLIPVFVLSMIFDWEAKHIIMGICSTVFFLTFPWWLRRLKKFLIEHTFYGGKKGVFSATGGQFFKIYFTAFMIGLLLSIPLGFVFMALVSTAKDFWLFAYVAPIISYAGYVLAWAYIRAESLNLVWNQTRLGPLRFHSTLRPFDLMKIYFTNALGIIMSLGMLIPWAVIRTVKYRADHLKVFQEGPLGQFQGSDQNTVTALGAETIDFFDVDLSL